MRSSMTSLLLAASFGRAAECGLIPARFAAMFQFRQVSFAMSYNGQGRIASFAGMSADYFLRLTVRHQDFGSFGSLPYTAGPYCLTLGTDHGERVAGFKGVEILFGIDFI